MSDTVEIKSQGTQGTPEPGAGMSQGHVLDLKLPIGWLLSAYGVLLTIYGLLTPKEMYAISLGLNVNLAWGILMIVVGGGFLLAAFLKKKGPKAG